MREEHTPEQEEEPVPPDEPGGNTPGQIPVPDLPPPGVGEDYPSVPPPPLGPDE